MPRWYVNSVFLPGLLLIALMASGCAGKPRPEAKTPAPGDVVYFVPNASNAVALTFDDGPNESATPQVLDILKRHGVKATFFLVGTNVERSAALARRVRDEGHVIGNHSYAHKRYDLVTPAETLEDISNGAKAIHSVLGMEPQLFRPPYGINGSGTVARCKSTGVTLVGWSADGNDWNPHTRQEIADSIVTQAVPGDIILLHDGFETAPAANRAATVDALELILDGLKKKGLNCVTVPELIKLAGPPVAEFDNGVRLLGYDLPLAGTIEPRQAFYVRYMWEIPPGLDVSTMKGLVRFETAGGSTFNDDHALPALDEVRTLRVRRVLVVPESARPGKYQCRVRLADSSRTYGIRAAVNCSGKNVLLSEGGAAR